MAINRRHTRRKLSRMLSIVRMASLRSRFFWLRVIAVADLQASRIAKVFRRYTCRVEMHQLVDKTNAATLIQTAVRRHQYRRRYLALLETRSRCAVEIQVKKPAAAPPPPSRPPTCPHTHATYTLPVHTSRSPHMGGGPKPVTEPTPPPSPPPPTHTHSPTLPLGCFRHGPISPTSAHLAWASRPY